MNQLQRFYQWIATSPPLFQLRPPFVTLEEVSAPPLCAFEEYKGNPRLGFLYQHLCTTLLSNSHHYQIVAEEIQLNAPDGRTIGAVDLILKNTESGQVEHWEVAIKFYLLHQGVWYGPNAHDQLDKKLDRMLTHQLKMSDRPEFRELFPLETPPVERLLMQGRLYINPFCEEHIPADCLGYELEQTQISGYWCYQNQWDQIGEPLYSLSKPLWAIGTEEHLEPIEKPAGKFVHAQTKSGQFWFVVEDSWPNKE